VNLKRVEQLLREYARHRPPERLFSDQAAARLQSRLAPAGSEDEDRMEDAASAPESGLPASAGAGPRRPNRLVAACSALAAAVIIVAVWIAAERTLVAVPQLVADGAHDRASLFRTTRGTPPAVDERGGLFYVGVKVDRPAFIRIIVLDDRGGLEVLPLDRSGSVERQVDAGAATVFGGYELESTEADGSTARIEAFIVLASARPLEAERIAEWMEESSSAVTGLPMRGAAGLARELRGRFHCSAKTVP
jgi:hypothetical protein